MPLFSVSTLGSPAPPGLWRRFAADTEQTLPKSWRRAAGFQMIQPHRQAHDRLGGGRQGGMDLTTVFGRGLGGRRRHRPVGTLIGGLTQFGDIVLDRAQGGAHIG